jgi:ABC-type proline/glycine betaine transport system substrate-binding protein
MDSAENYARQWAKRKNGDFSEWVKSVRSLI